jgi:hypothetical protein
MVKPLLNASNMVRLCQKAEFRIASIKSACFISILMCLVFESDAFVNGVHRLDNKPKIVNGVCALVAPKVLAYFSQLSIRIKISKRFRHTLISPGMSALGPIGPFAPFRSTYCSSGVVEKEMGELSVLAEKLWTGMLGFQVWQEQDWA